MGKSALARPEASADPLDRNRYFESILAACPDFVDEVIIEPDGEWHTEDNKYASPGWRSQQAEAAASKANTPVEEKPRSSLQNGSSSAGSSTDAQKETHTAGDTRANASRMQEVVALDDSDDDDEPPLKHITKPAVRRILSGDSDERGSVDRLVEDALGQHSANASRSSESGPGSALAAAAEPVIDLTLTDDEEELAGPVLPSWAADIPALAKADKRERSMSSMMEAEDRVALRRRLASNGLSEHNRKSLVRRCLAELNLLSSVHLAYEPGFRSNATSPIPPISAPAAAGPVSAPATSVPPALPRSDSVNSGSSSLRVKLSLPPRPRIDPLPSWMDAEPSRSSVNVQNGIPGGPASWLDAPISRTDSTGTNSPNSTVRIFGCNDVGRVQGSSDFRMQAHSPAPGTASTGSALPRGFTHTMQRVHVDGHSSSIGSPAGSSPEVNGRYNRAPSSGL